MIIDFIWKLSLGWLLDQEPKTSEELSDYLNDMASYFGE